MNVIPRNVLSVFLTMIFVVVSITGVMMFFKIRIFSSEMLHIWLGFVFVVISCLHLVKNWHGFISYFKKRSTRVSVVIGVLAIAMFMIIPLLNSHEESINPKGKIIGTMMNASLSKVADFVDLDTNEIVKRFAEKQMIVSSKQSVSEIAKANNKTTDEVLSIVFSTPTAQ